MFKILVLNGPNLNLMGNREPRLYSTTSLQEINDRLMTLAKTQNIALECRQSNAEHELVTIIQESRQQDVAGIIINAAAYTHTSIALRDALLAVAIPFIEVHITNTYAREEFRSRSYLSDIATGVIVGLGPVGYELALTAFTSILTNKTTRE